MPSRPKRRIVVAAATFELDGAPSSIMTWASVLTASGAYRCVRAIACPKASRRASRYARENVGSLSHRYRVRWPTSAAAAARPIVCSLSSAMIVRSCGAVRPWWSLSFSTLPCRTDQRRCRRPVGYSCRRTGRVAWTQATWQYLAGYGLGIWRFGLHRVQHMQMRRRLHLLQWLLSAH